MKNNFILLLIFLRILIFPNPIWSQNILASASNGDLMIVNPDICSTSILCNGSCFLDIAYEGGVLYGIYSNDIYTIDTNTCVNTLFVSLPEGGGNAMVGDGNGSLYANNMNFIYKIDIATQTFSIIGDVGYSSIGDLAFNKGFLYQLVFGGVNISTLIKITLNPFSVTTIGNLNFNNFYPFGLVNLNPNTDTLYATVSDPPNSYNYLYKINVNDAGTTLFCSSGMGIANSYITGLTNVNNGTGCINPINYTDNLSVITNPSASFLTIQTKNARTEKYVLTLHTLHGQQKILKNIEFNNSYELNLSNISNGIYFLMLHNEKEQKVWKIAIQK